MRAPFESETVLPSIRPVVDWLLCYYIIGPWSPVAVSPFGHSLLSDGDTAFPPFPFFSFPGLLYSLTDSPLGARRPKKVASQVNGVWPVGKSEL